MMRFFTMLTVGLCVVLVSCGSGSTELASVDDEPSDASTTTTSGAPDVSQDAQPTLSVPPCSDFPDWDWNDASAEYTEAQLISLTNQVWSVIGPDSGLQGAGIGRENRVSLEFVDPPTEGFDELLALLPDGYCIETIAYTPEPPEFLDVIDEAGQFTGMPDGVERVDISFAPGSEPTPQTTELILWIDERACRSQPEMGERLLGPDLYESDSEILIEYAAVTQLTIQTCEGHPPTEVRVTLDQPVGDREIRKANSGAVVKVYDDY